MHGFVGLPLGGSGWLWLRVSVAMVRCWLSWKPGVGSLEQLGAGQYVRAPPVPCARGLRELTA